MSTLLSDRIYDILCDLVEHGPTVIQRGDVGFVTAHGGNTVKIDRPQPKGKFWRAEVPIICLDHVYLDGTTDGVTAQIVGGSVILHIDDSAVDDHRDFLETANQK